MRSTSLPSVRVTWFDREAVWAAVRAFVAEVTQRHPEVEQVVVFGSLAREASVPGSDVDVLLVLKNSPLHFLSRLPLYHPQRPFPVGIDVFPYTREELEEMRQQGRGFIAQAFAEGIVLFERPPTPDHSL